MRKNTKLVSVAIAVAGTLGVFATPAFGSITCANPAGNTVNGQCNGTQLQNVNPGGHAPSGWNK